MARRQEIPMTDYIMLKSEIAALCPPSFDPTANLANAASLIFNSVEDINWAGFYILRGDRLVLGPFMGKPACVYIPVGKGVCGTSAESRNKLVVHDVLSFSGHIACDSASRSEAVFPIFVSDRLFGVMDIDSTTPGRFSEVDADGLEEISAMIGKILEEGELPENAGGKEP